MLGNILGFDLFWFVGSFFTLVMQTPAQFRDEDEDEDEDNRAGSKGNWLRNT